MRSLPTEMLIHHQSMPPLAQEGYTLAIHPQPSTTEAATFVGRMDHTTGRPTLPWTELHTLAQACPYWCKILALPNTPKGGTLAVLFGAYDAPDPHITVLLAEGPPLTGTHGLFDLHTEAPDGTWIFSPHIYQIFTPNAAGYTRPFGSLDWRHAPAAHAPEDYAWLTKAAAHALDHARGLPPVVAAHAHVPGTLVAPWILGGQAPHDFAAILQGALQHTQAFPYGALDILGGVLHDDGTITPPRATIHNPRGMQLMGPPKSAAPTLDWCNQRLAGTHLPWPAHTLVAQTHHFNGHQSTFSKGTDKKAAVLCTLSFDRTTPKSAHEKLDAAARHHQQAQHHAQVSAW